MSAVTTVAGLLWPNYLLGGYAFSEKTIEVLITAGEPAV